MCYSKRANSQVKEYFYNLISLKWANSQVEEYFCNLISLKLLWMHTDQKLHLWQIYDLLHNTKN
jgi:hypothetical protein